MAEFYAFRIIQGKTTFAKVPARLKDAVTLDPIPPGSYSFVVWYI